MTSNSTASFNVPGISLSEMATMMPQFTGDPVGFMAQCAEKFGPVFKMPIGDKETVFLNKAEFAEQVLRLDFQDFGQSPYQEELLRPLLGRSMAVVADHDYWKQMHSIIMPMFTPKMLRKYYDGIVEAIAEEVEHLGELADHGETVGLLEFMRKGVFAGLMKSIFIRGIAPDDGDRLLEWFTHSDDYVIARLLTGVSVDQDMSPALVKGRECLQKISDYVYDLIAWRRANPVADPEDMLDVLMIARKPDGAELTEVEVKDNGLSLFHGGQETTPSIVTWAFGLLSANPDKRERLLEEVDRVLGGRTPTFQDLDELKYTEMVFREAARLYPPFPFIEREALNDVRINGYDVPAGTPLGYVGWTINRDPEQWPEPDAFLPERHLPEAAKQRSKCAFISFGYGERRCTGERVARMEGVLMLAMISQKFLLDRVGGGLPEHRVIASIKPADGMQVHVRRRPA